MTETSEVINSGDAITKIREILIRKRSFMYPQYYREIEEIVGDGNGNRERTIYTDKKEVSL